MANSAFAVFSADREGFAVAFAVEARLAQLSRLRRFEAFSRSPSRTSQNGATPKGEGCV